MPLICFSLVVSLLTILLPEIASAQVLDLKLDDNLNNVCGGSLFSSHQANSPTTATFCKVDGLFARIFCIVESTISLILGTTFCAIRDAWLAPFGAMMLLFMACVGGAFILGIINFTVKEVTTLLLKMGIVTLFVTNAEFALQIAYSFYIGMMQETVRMMMEGFEAVVAKSAVLNLTTPGQGYLGDVNDLTDTVADGSGNAFSSIDKEINKLQDMIVSGVSTGTGKFCSVLGFFGMIILALPFASVIVFVALIKFLGFFARAAYGYIYALVMTTFLVAAMPIFVSFALFKITSDLFEHWLRYLGSNVIQIMIVFALMAFASMLDFMEFLERIDSMIVNQATTANTGMFSYILGAEIPIFPCALCDAPNFVTTMGVPVLAKTPCTSQNPMPFGELYKQTGLAKFLFINGAAIYVLSSMMDEFMKTGPDMARMLGGAKLVHTIGGIANMGGGKSLDNPVNRITTDFEAGVQHAADNRGGDPNREDRKWWQRNPAYEIYDLATQGADAAIDGQYLLKGDEFKQARAELYDTNRELFNTYEDKKDNYLEWRDRADEVRENVKFGETLSEQEREVMLALEKSEQELRKAGSAINAASRDLVRRSHTEQEYFEMQQGDKDSSLVEKPQATNSDDK